MSEIVAKFLLPPLRAFRRDIGDRSFLVIGAAVIIAVASVTAVDMFTERVRNALERQSGALLAADLVVVSNYPVANRYVTAADALALDSTQTIAMRSVVSSGENLQLTELKAVADGYPLRGAMRLADEPFANSHQSDTGPEVGTAWVEARLLSLLDTAVGEYIQIGSGSFEIAKILVLEPDRGGDLFNIAPRVMLNVADIPTTRLIMPGSRVRYSLLLAGEQEAIEKYRLGLELRDGDRLLSPKSARPEIRSAVRRAEQYLGLATLTTVILAGVGIALAARSFSARRRDTVALLRTLGATKQFVLSYFVLEIALLGVLAAGIGVMTGFAAQEVIAESMSGWTQTALPPPTLTSGLRAAFVALVALIGFALPPLMHLRNVPPLRVLRSDADAEPVRKSTIVIYAVTASIFVAPWRAGDLQITLWSLLGLVMCLGILVIVAVATTKAIAKTQPRANLVWRFGIANIARRGVLTTIQISALGLGLMALLVLGVVRNDLLDNWLSSLPPDAPNQFLINIQPSDVSTLALFFEKRDLSPPDFFPMIRGRLTALNGRPISAESYLDPRARRLVDREFNLSSAVDLKSHNIVVSGQWWNANDDAAQFSVEADIAQTLKIKLGDLLTYRVAEREFSGRVSNFRAVEWESMKVNFFVEAPPALLEDLPATFITSFRLDPSNYSIMRDLVQEFPSVTVIDVAALIDHIRAIMRRSAAAIEFVFLFTLVAGILVLIAAVQATQDERVFESALLKTLGASRAVTLRIMIAEFVTIGFISGTVAGCVAVFSGWLIATKVLEISYVANPWVIVIGITAGIFAVASVGSVSVYNALARPAATVLRFRV